MNTLLTNDVRLLLLRTYVFIMNTLNFLYGGTKVVVKGLIKAIQPNKYVFFDGYNTAIHVSNVKDNGPGIPQIAWYYDADKSLFYKDDSSCEEKHISWLSANISYNGLTLYSLDDYVSSVKYRGAESPSAAILLGGWSLYTGTVLDTNLRLELDVITEDGNELTILPWHVQPEVPDFPPLLIETSAEGERNDMPLLSLPRLN
jgi:hypothetical protein